MGAEPEQIRDVFPNVSAITGPQAYESVIEAVHAAAPAPHDPFLDLIPEQGVKLTPRHYAYLKISEGCNNRCTFCIIPKLRGDLVSRPAADVLREAEKLVKAGVKELIVISQDTSAYGVDIKYAESVWRDRECARDFSICARARLARRLGAAAIRLSLSARRRGLRADERRHGAALYRHALPACLAQGAEGHAPAGQPGKDAGAHPRLARHLPRSDHPLDLHCRLSRRDARTISGCCSIGSKRPSSTASAPSNTNRSPARAPTISASSPCRTRSNRAAGSASWRSQQRSAPRSCRPRSANGSTCLIDHGGVGLVKGRSKGDAPEIDGAVHVTTRRPLRAGDIVSVKIERADAYDLWGTAG